MKRDIPWKRLVAEGGVIVASILLAFWIDAWWDGRQERAEERDLLVALAQEFATNRQRLAEAEAFHGEIRDQSLRFLQVAADPGAAPELGEVDFLLERQWWWGGETTFASGVASTIIDGGRLALIDDEELRTALADWPRSVEAAREDERQGAFVVNEYFLPYMQQNGSLVQLWNASTVAPGGAGIHYSLQDWERLPSGPGTVDHRALVRDRELQNIVTRRYAVQEDILGEFGRLRDHMERIIAMLDVPRGR